MTVKRKPRTKTQVSTIASAIRRIWQWSPEKAEIVKRANKHCEECGEPVSNTKKQQEKKGGKRLEVHHMEQCEMTKLAKMIHSKLFPGPDKLLGLCEQCHREADVVINREKELT
jgi:hypothetical protein